MLSSSARHLIRSRFALVLSVLLTMLLASAWRVSVASRAPACSDAANNSPAFALPINCAESADGSKIVFITPTNRMYIINADGSGLTPIAEDSLNAEPEFSPDGNKIVFTRLTSYDTFSAYYQVFVTNSDGTGMTQLTDSPEFKRSPHFSFDGNKILYQSYGDDLMSYLYVMNADGSDDRDIGLLGHRDRFPEAFFSPDNSKIVFTARGTNGPSAPDDIYIINVDGTGRTNLTNTPNDDGNPAFSPDGSRIAYYTDSDSSDESNYDIYTMNADGSGKTRLTSNPASEFSSIFSPDGSRIAFTTNRDGNYEIYIMDADGTNETRLTDNPGSDGSILFSPDGSRILYTVFPLDSAGEFDYDNIEMRLMNLDGSDSRPLTDERRHRNNYYSFGKPDRDGDGRGDACDNCPADANSDQADNDGDRQGDLCDADDDNDNVSDGIDNCPLNPNTDQLDTDEDNQGNTCDTDDDNDRTPDESDNCPLSANGYPIAFASRRDGNIEIYKMNLDGTGVTRLTNRSSVDDEPSFSSDGARILFTSNRFNSRQEIYVMDADGSPVTRLTNIAGGNRTAVFSPDGTRITFVSTRDDGKRSVYVMDADGTDQTRLTFAQGFSGTADNPTFNHTGTRIAFESDRGSVGQANQDIFTISPNGADELRLTTAVGKDSDPAYSRDGTRIVFVSERNGNREIYIMNHDGSNQTRLTANPAIDRQPAFTPDGNFIVFTSNRNGDDELFLMNLDGTGVTSVTNTLNENAFPSLAPQLDADNDGVGDTCDLHITTTLNPIADTWVQGADATRDTNYGADSQLQIKRTFNPGAGRGRRGFLKFDFSQVTDTISSARLRIFGSLTEANLPATPMIVQKVADTTWDELAMTWNNQPPTASPNALAQIIVAGAGGAWYEFDLTAFILAERAEGRTVVALRLINQQPTGTSGTSYTRLNSREATENRPQLVIEQ